MHLFIQDLTEDTINQKESSKLRENFSVIQETFKIVLCSYENGKYEYTSEIYNILAINPNDYPNYKDLVNLFIFPEDKHLLDNVMNLTTDNPDVQGTYRVKNNNNEIKYIQAHNKAIFNENGELIRIIGLLQDITEETLAKQESAKLNENFNVIESTSKIFIADFDGEKYSYTNEAYNILGINPKNYSNNFNLFTEFVLPEDLQKCEEAMFLTPEKPESQFTFRIKTDNDEIKYLICQNKALFDSKGELIRIIGFVQDITEETLVEQEALRLQDNFNVIQETSKVVLCLFENGEYSYTPEIYNILGIKSDDYPNNVELVGEYIIPEDVESYESIFNLTPEHTDEHNTLRIKNANSEIKYIQTHNKAIFTNQGELIRIIGFIQDVTEEKLAQNEASRLTNNFNLIQNSSKIFIGEYENSKFSFTKEAYNILEINSDDFTDEDDILTLHILPEDKNKMIKCTDFNSGEYNFHNEFRVKTGKGNIKYLKSQVMVKNDDNGDLLHQVGFIQDITEETVAKKSALDLQRSLEIIQSASKIVIAHVKDGKYTWTSEIYDILEINPEDYPNDIDLIGLFTVPEDQGKIFNAHNHLTPENLNGHNLSTIITPNGNMKVLEGFLKAEFGDNGEILEIICFIHEITDKVNREKELEQLSEDRKILLQEVHHRVKNNLQLILSFLNIESRYNRDNPEYVIEQTKNRINTMALTHEEVYQSPSVSKINLENFLTEGVSNIFNTYTSCKIKLNFDIEPIEIEVDKGIPIGLLVNEVALNTIKYAFPNTNEGNFYVNLKSDGDVLVLKLWDDGVGLPENVDLFDSDSLGFIIIRNLTQQLDGELTILEDVTGFGIKIVFKSDN